MKTTINMRKSFLLSGLLIAGFFILSLSLLYNGFMDVSYSASHSSAPPVKDSRPIIYFGVVSRYSPHLLYEGYQPLMDYLSRETPYRFSLRLSRTYRETIDQLLRGEVAAAFLGTYIYIQNRSEKKLRCILKPLNKNGKPFFHSVVITGPNSSIKILADLKGTRLALPSPDSYSANWLFKETFLTRSDFDSIRHFDFHNTVVYRVLKGEFDAGVVKDRAAEKFADAGISIIYQSALIPASPIVVHENTKPEITRAITTALLKINIQDEKYKRLVQNWDAEFQHGFTRAADADYSLPADGAK